MAELIDLTGSDDENTVPKPHPKHDRSNTPSGRVDGRQRLPPLLPRPAPSIKVESSHSGVQTPKPHIPSTVVSDLTRSRGSQDSIRLTTPPTRHLTPQQQLVNDGADIALQEQGQSADAGFEREHDWPTDPPLPPLPSERAHGDSIQGIPGTSAATESSLMYYPLFSATPRKRKPSNEERSPNSRVFRTPSKVEVPRKASFRTPQKIPGRDITTYLMPQTSAQPGERSGDKSDNTVKSSSHPISESEDRHVSNTQSEKKTRPVQASEVRETFAQNLKEWMRDSSLKILKNMEVKKPSDSLDVRKLGKLYEEFINKVERTVNERVEDHVLGEDRRTTELTKEDIEVAFRTLGPGLREETRKLCDLYLEIVESRCAPSQDKPASPPPSQKAGRVPEQNVQNSSNQSFYSPSPSSPTESDESLPHNDGHGLSTLSIRAASTSPSNGAPSPHDEQLPQNDHVNVKNSKFVHYHGNGKIEGETGPARARPSRTAGKSAASLISSLYENPFGSIDSSSPLNSQSQNDGSLAKAALTKRSLQTKTTPSTGKTSATYGDLRLSSDKRSLSDGNASSISAVLAITSLEVQHKPIREAIVEEHMQERLIAVPRTLLSENLNAPISRPRHGSMISGYSTENPQQLSSAFTVLESNVKDPSHRPTSQVASLLRRREIGSTPCGPIVRPMAELPRKLTEHFKPWRSWRGASNDVVAVAWAPDSIRFAAGAAAHSNDEDLHYNRPCNFLYGNLQKNVLHELPDHCVDRKKPEHIPTGPSANPTVYQSCDPKVYMTVTSVKFSPFINHMYSASEDQTVRVWDMDSLECLNTIQHETSVTCLDVSPSYQGLFAAGCSTLHKPVHVCRISESGLVDAGLSLSSSRAEIRQDWTLYPECLQWGQSSSTEDLLLGGFLQWGREEIGVREGHLCLWDTTTGQDLKVTPGSRAVHAASWHPSMPYFAAGVTRGLTVTNRLDTKTVVRVWDLRTLKRNIMEYECPAGEITDVTFHPMDRNIATAGCTNGSSYVWDFRWPDQPIHALRHGKSVMMREEKDTGVMMSIWGKGSSLYYTGSSDGKVLAWDIRRHPVDVLVQDVGHVGAGISSGSLSPDGSHLLVGDVTGGIHVLSSAPWAPRPEADHDPAHNGCPMTIVRATKDQNISQTLDVADNNPGTAGIEAAHELLTSHSIVIHPEFGAGKGPNYIGPYAKSERKEEDDHGPVKGIGHLQKHIYRKQVYSRRGEIRETNAKPIRDLHAARREMLDNPFPFDEHEHGQAPPPGAVNQGSKAPDSIDPRKPEKKKKRPDSLLDSEESDEDEDVTDSDGSSEDGERWWPRLGEAEIKLARMRPRSSLHFDQDGPENYIPTRRRRR